MTIAFSSQAPKEKLELCWVGKQRRRVLEPRILLEDERQGYKNCHRKTPHTDNRLIFGDNLLALKSLEQEFTGQVKCVIIDPPYNTGSAFTHYEDGLEHSVWLSMMRDRLETIHRLLAADGSLWITIDDNEAHYLKVLCDEIFGRVNFKANVVWQKRTSPEARISLGPAHDNLLVYAKDISSLVLNKLPLTESQTKNYKNPDDDPRGPWSSTDFTAQGWRPNQMYPIVTPAGVTYDPPPGRCWANIESVFNRLQQDDRIWFGADGRARPRLKTFLDTRTGISPWTWWTNQEVGHNQEAKKEIIALFGGDNAFDTPKPERLIKHILDIATDPGDLVLDSFAGSGTTGAVAHKMMRRWIMIELGEHCHTHIIPRLKQIIDGLDTGGVSTATGWTGGGGFRYFRLAPTILERDRYERDIISKKYNAVMLAEAMCKLHNYTYAPSATIYWQHGRSSETDYIYVTTQTLSQSHLAALTEEVGPHRTLLVLCAAFRGNEDAFPNLTLKKIGSFAASCKWERPSARTDARSDATSNTCSVAMSDPIQDVVLRHPPVWQPVTTMEGVVTGEFSNSRRTSP